MSRLTEGLEWVQVLRIKAASENEAGARGHRAVADILEKALDVVEAAGEIEAMEVAIHNKAFRKFLGAHSYFSATPEEEATDGKD